MKYSEKLNVLQKMFLRFGKSWDDLCNYIFQNDYFFTEFVIKVTRANCQKDFNSIVNFYLDRI